MILAWMLYATAVACAAGAAACALAGAARALGRPTRLAWIVALLFSATWPGWRLARHALASGQQRAAAAAVALPPVVVAAGHDVASAIATRIPTAGRTVSLVLLATWCLTSIVLLARLLRGVRAIGRERRRWRASEVDGVRVLVSPETGPAVVGVRRPAIVLPEWALALDSGLLRLVLRHEQEHVRAVDTVPRLLGALMTALMPWNPALWWQASRLVLATEVDCDARVLRADARRERYGLLLLAIAQRQSTAMLAPALSEPTSHLERRIVAMQRSAPRRPMLVAAALTAAAVVVLVLACSAPSPDAPAAPRAIGRASAVTAPVADRATAHAGPYFAFHVDKAATLVTGPGKSQMPRYPAALEAQRKGGMVFTQFVVDTTGAVDLSSVKVVDSSDPAFTTAVREALPTMHFHPAVVGGRPVRQLVEMPFTFLVPPGESNSSCVTAISSHATWQACKTSVEP